MTVLVVSVWLALQYPAGILLGRMLQARGTQPALAPAATRR